MKQLTKQQLESIEIEPTNYNNPHYDFGEVSFFGLLLILLEDIFDRSRTGGKHTK